MMFKLMVAFSGDYAPLLNSGSQATNAASLIWYSLLFMTSFIDCDMHLVFRGIDLYTVVNIEGFIKNHFMTQQFERRANQYMHDIQ